MTQDNHIVMSGQFRTLVMFLFCCVLSPIRLSYFLNELKLGWVINFIKFRKLSHQKAGGLECLANRFCKRLCFFFFFYIIVFSYDFVFTFESWSKFAIDACKRTGWIIRFGIVNPGGIIRLGIVSPEKICLPEKLQRASKILMAARRRQHRSVI